MTSQLSNAVSHVIVRPVDQNLQAKEKSGKENVLLHKRYMNINMPKTQIWPKVNKKFFVFIFENMIVWFKVGGNTSFGLISNAIWMV